MFNHKGQIMGFGEKIKKGGAIVTLVTMLSGGLLEANSRYTQIVERLAKVEISQTNNAETIKKDIKEIKSTLEYIRRKFE